MGKQTREEPGRISQHHTTNLPHDHEEKHLIWGKGRGNRTTKEKDDQDGQLREMQLRKELIYSRKREREES